MQQNAATDGQTEQEARPTEGQIPTQQPQGSDEAVEGAIVFEQIDFERLQEPPKY